MRRLAVKLGYSGLDTPLVSNEKAVFNPCLGCKGSSVQIWPRRPIYPPGIIQDFVRIPSEYRQSKCADKCSKMQEIAGVAGGKIGVFSDDLGIPVRMRSFDRNLRCLFNVTFQSSTDATFSNRKSKLKTSIALSSNLSRANQNLPASGGADSYEQALH